MRPALLVAPAVGGILILTLTGCSISVGTPGSTGSSVGGAGSTQPTDAPSVDASVPAVSVPPVSAPTTGRSAATDTATSAASSGSGASGRGALAPGFPLPAGVIADIVADGTTNEGAGSISVRDANAAYTFWVRELPLHGFHVGDAQFSGGLGEIPFTGHGCAGDSQLAFTGGTTVHYQCDAG